MRGWGIVVNIISTAVLLALLVLAVAFAGVRLFGLTPYAVLSGSMEPLFHVGSLVYVRGIDPSEIRPGDPVTFQKGDAVATHQAYEIDSNAQLIRTQGIANVNSDGSIMVDAEPVPFSDVIGVPVATVPYLGYVSAFVGSSAGTFVVVASAVLAIGLLFLVDRAKDSPKSAPSKHMRQA